MADEQYSEEVQRWTAKRRAALVFSLLKGETTAADAARRHGLKVAEVEEWRERFLLGPENALRARPKEEDALREEEVNRLKRKVGELTIMNRVPTIATNTSSLILLVETPCLSRRTAYVFVRTRSR